MIRQSLSIVLILGIFAILLAAPVVIAAGQTNGGSDQPVVVIAAPWDSAVHLASRTGGKLIQTGRFSSVVLTQSRNKDFTESLYENGAWLVLSADLASLLCKPEPKET